MAGLGMFLTDVHAAGLEVAQNTRYTTAFYWDMNPQAAEWSRGYLTQIGLMPTMLQIGVHGAVLHYLKAVAGAGTSDAGAVMAKMQELPVKDIFTTKEAKLRADGQVIGTCIWPGSRRRSNRRGHGII